MGDEKHQGRVVLRRLWLLGGFFGLCCTVLLFRLWYVQVACAHTHAGEVTRQSIRRIRLSPVRGRMFSRNGHVLADNDPSFDLVFHLSEMRQPGPREATEDYLLLQAGELARRIGRVPPFSRAFVHRRLEVYPALPLIVFTRLDKRELALLSEQLPPVPGTEITPTFVRAYPYPDVATHVLGFAGRTPPPDAEESAKYSYVMPELRGRAGLEKSYDKALSGNPGMRLVRVDTLGYVHEQIGDRVPPRDGWDLVLTLDLRAQRIAEEELRGLQGALVVVNVDTGEVIAMASSPTYNLAELSASRYSELARDDEHRPLINRAVDGTYLPGSIVKPLIGLAALKAGIVDPQETMVPCPGFFRLGDTRIRCWLRSGHGPMRLLPAIEQSCNTFFIDVGLRTGMDNIRPMMLGAGFGKAPDIDLPGAAAGLVPSRPWAVRQWGRAWLAIDTAFLSIGQGAVNVSPLQAALYAAALANGGTVFRPYLVQEIRDREGQTRQVTAPRAVSQLPVSEERLAIVREGMRRVVNGTEATARAARTPAISLAGKTGTAEVKRGDESYNNAWFIAFGPVENPKYAAAVVVERGVSGGRTAAPIAGRFFERWLTRVDEPVPNIRNP
ncbi:MAG: penicillin-binding protein 2 [Candidatus Pacebacteria bacterium]|nr:penicillin-binding protein 2 [Candidatus Paceibacterota bacterium]